MTDMKVIKHMLSSNRLVLLQMISSSMGRQHHPQTLITMMTMTMGEEENGEET